GALEAVRALGYGPLIVIGLFVIGGLLIMPVTALIVATILAYGALTGFFYALVGVIANAAAVYAVGAHFGRRGIRRLAGERINAVSSQLAQRGILTVFLLRIIPVAPFSIINLVAGASHVSFRDYLIGTLLGMAPGMLAIALLIDRILAILHNPTPRTLVLFIAMVAVLAVAALLLSHWAHRRRRRGV
ncbi:MAG TPA: VTT domain-containing protein, partial [Thiohalobacter sp.]|nr:VTT domain-containing protein [Thiohalobacter sp.]